MKLCRFDLVSSPGSPRTGIVYGGKVYETDGENAVGVHEWTDARLLAPVGQPSSFRFFPYPDSDDFRYLNPGIVLGPHGSVLPAEGLKLGCLPCLAVVVAGGGSVVPVSEADGLVLGIAVANVFFHFNGSKPDLKTVSAPALDVGASVGPALTTPDELDDALVDEAQGRRYRLDMSLQVDGETVWSGTTESMPKTIAEVFGQASLTTRLRQGDLFALAIPSVPAPLDLRSGTVVKVVSERLGTLATKIT